SSGADDATVITYTGALLAIKAGYGHLLIDPSAPDYRAKYHLPPQYLTGVIFGLANNVSAKRTAIVRFLAALNDAAKVQTPANAQRIANDDAQSDMFKATPKDVLLQQV